MAGVVVQGPFRSAYRARARRNNRKASTVLELVVIMVVIAIVAAVALPALMSAQMSAKKAGCQNHFRQVGLAVHARLSSHGQFPSNEPIVWPIALGEYLQDRVLVAALTSSQSTNEAISLRCPLDRFVLNESGAVINQAFNPQLLGASESKLAGRWGGTVVTAECASEFGAAWSTGPLAFPAAVSSAHRDAHCLMADGSVRRVNPWVSPEVIEQMLVSLDE